MRRQAIARLDAVPNVAEKLAALLDRNRRPDALVALNLGNTSKFPVSDAIRRRTWIVAGSIAWDMTPGMGEVKVVSPELVKLCRSLGYLSTQRGAVLEVRGEHRPSWSCCAIGSALSSGKCRCGAVGGEHCGGALGGMVGRMVPTDGVRIASIPRMFSCVAADASA
jgi:hypothetical protein